MTIAQLHDIGEIQNTEELYDFDNKKSAAAEVDKEVFAAYDQNQYSN